MASRQYVVKRTKGVYRLIRDDLENSEVKVSV